MLGEVEETIYIIDDEDVEDEEVKVSIWGLVYVKSLLTGRFRR